MATSPRRSLVSRAGAAARKVVRRTGDEVEEPAGAAAPRKSAANGAAKKTAVKKAAVKKTAAKKSAPTKKAAATKAAATKAAATKAAPKKAAPKKATKAAPVNAGTAKQAPAKKAATATRSAPATKATAAKKSAPAKATPDASTSKPAKKSTSKPAQKSASKSASKSAEKSAKKSAEKSAGTSATTSAPRAGALVVLEQEQPWTKAELAEVTTQLHADVDRLTAELAVAEQDLVGLMREGSDGAGNDQADVGTATFERDQEMTVVHNAREMLLQSQHALERIADGSYGVCENCGNPIGKNRLMAFPRATLCMTCKQREERR